MKTDFGPQFAALRTLSNPVPPSLRYNQTIEALKIGGFVRINDGITYRVQNLSTYQETDESYKRKGAITTELELFAIETGQTAWLEWSKDDGIEVYLTTAAPLKLRDLRDDEGGAVDEDDLDNIVEEEDSVICSGTTYLYDDDWAAIYRRTPEGKSERVYFYEFEAIGGACLTIEEWQGLADGAEEYQVYLSVPIRAYEIIQLE